MRKQPFTIVELSAVRKCKLFTLIELLVVISIIIVLSGISIGAYSLARDGRNKSVCEAMIMQIETALENYKAQTGYYIQQKAEDVFTIDMPDASDVDFTDFIDYEKLKKNNIDMATRALLDPHGKPFRYKCPGVKNITGFDLYNAGMDGDYATTADNLSNF